MFILHSSLYGLLELLGAMLELETSMPELETSTPELLGTSLELETTVPELLSTGPATEEEDDSPADDMRAKAIESTFLSNSSWAIFTSIFVLGSPLTSIILPSPQAIIIIATATAARICGIISINLSFFFTIITLQECRTIYTI